jgi:hypothetical protein
LFLSALSKLVLDLPQAPAQAQAQACNSMLLCFFQPDCSNLCKDFAISLNNDNDDDNDEA